MNCNPESEKACLFTLIVYTDTSQRADYFLKIAALISEKFPCRTIAVKENTTIDKPYFQLTENSEKSQRDFFTIEVGGKDVLRVPFVILPLLVPDLPVYLLWGQNPTKENPVLSEIEKFTTRLIFDSETSSDLRKFCRNMLDRMHSGPEVIDVNWSRILGWREVLAQTYDNPEGFEQLAKATEIKITYNSSSDTTDASPGTRAIYLATWLASRLNLKRKDIYSSSTGIIRYEEGHTIALIPVRNANFDPAEIVEIEVKGSDDYVCNLKRIDRNQVEIHAYNQYQCELPFTLLMPTLDSGRNIMQEIFYQKTDPQYIAAIKSIAETEICSKR